VLNDVNQQKDGFAEDYRRYVQTRLATIQTNTLLPSDICRIILFYEPLYGISLVVAGYDGLPNRQKRILLKKWRYSLWTATVGKRIPSPKLWRLIDEEMLKIPKPTYRTLLQCGHCLIDLLLHLTRGVFMKTSEHRVLHDHKKVASIPQSLLAWIELYYDKLVAHDPSIFQKQYFILTNTWNTLERINDTTSTIWQQIDQCLAAFDNEQ
jgi:hypothetical protein